jgi:hypothetical protein
MKSGTAPVRESLPFQVLTGPPSSPARNVT